MGLASLAQLIEVLRQWQYQSSDENQYDESTPFFSHVDLYDLFIFFATLVNNLSFQFCSAVPRSLESFVLAFILKNAQPLANLPFLKSIDEVKNLPLLCVIVLVKRGCLKILMVSTEVAIFWEKWRIANLFHRVWPF